MRGRAAPPHPGIYRVPPPGKRPFHSENASYVIHSNYTGETRKCNYHRSFRICVRGTLVGESYDSCMIALLSKCIQSSLKRKARVFKSVFEKRRFRDGLAWTVGLTVENKLRV